jgi:hypothetical protein
MTLTALSSCCAGAISQEFPFGEENYEISGLMDAPRFARSMEAALRAMWRISGQENEEPERRRRAS